MLLFEIKGDLSKKNIKKSSSSSPPQKCAVTYSGCFSVVSQAVEEAFVPVIKMTYDGIEVS